MLGKGVCFLILIPTVLLVACAKPNYQEPGLAGVTRGNESLKSCQYLASTQSACLSLTWDVFPTETEYGAFTVSFFDMENPSVLVDPLDSLAVVLWMPSMGHGSSPVKIEKKGMGVFKVDRVFFVMPGEWEIRFQFKTGEQVIEEVIQRVTL